MNAQDLYNELNTLKERNIKQEGIIIELNNQLKSIESLLNTEKNKAV